MTTVSLVVGEPIEVASDATDEEREATRQVLEERLAALEERARELAGRSA